MLRPLRETKRDGGWQGRIMSLSRSPQHTPRRRGGRGERCIIRAGAETRRARSRPPSSHRESESLSGSVTHSLLNSLIANEGAESTSDRAENGREEEKLHFLLPLLCLSLPSLSAHSSSKFNSLAFVNEDGGSGRQWRMRERGKGNLTPDIQAAPCC